MTTEQSANAVGPGTPSGATAVDFDPNDAAAFRDFFENATVGMHFVGADGTILYANRADYELLGYTRDEWIGQDILQFYADKDAANEIFACLGRGEQLTDVEAAMIARDGSTKHVLIDSSAVFRGGKFVHTRCVVRDNGERKREQNALRSSELRYRSLAEAIPALVSTTDAAGGVSYHNQRWLDYVGRTGEEMEGRWGEIVHPDDMKQLTARWAEALATSSAVENEYRVRRSDGEYRWHRSFTAPIRDSSGAITMWIDAAIEFHDRREAEDALQEALEETEALNRRLDALLENSPVGIGFWDRDFRFVRINDALSRMNGLPEDAELGRTIEEAAPEIWAQVAPHFRRALAGESIVDVDISAPDRSGEVRHVLASYYPVTGAAKEIVGVGAIINDVTERARAEQQVYYQLGLNRTITNNAGSALFLIDPEGKPTFMNPAAEKMTGFTLGEIKDAPLHAAIHHTRPGGAPYATEDCPIDRASESMIPIRDYEDSFIRKDGTLFPALTSVAPLEQDGVQLGAVVEVRDITNEKRAEEERERLIGDLQQANAAKDDFLGMVSHELKTPITTIRGNAEILRLRSAKLTDADRAGALDDIGNESERLQRIIDNLLVLARLEHGQEIGAEPLLVRRVIQRLVAEHRQRASHREIEVISDVVATPVYGEPVYLEQILRNLLSNAEKYSPPDSPITIRLAAEGGELCVSVLDCGAGFAPGEAERIFAPFYRSPDTASRVSGVGIGLAVCKRLVAAQGGRLWARNREGGGAEIGFALPIIDPGDGDE